MFRAPCFHHQEVKIVLYSLRFHHTETSEWSKITKIQFCKYEQIVVKFVCEFFGCDYSVPLIINMLCHVEVMFIQLLNLLEKFCASSWLITKVNILRCTAQQNIKIPVCYFSFSCITFINCISYCACWGCCSGVAELSVVLGYEPEYWSHHSGFKCLIVLTFEGETSIRSWNTGTDCPMTLNYIPE